VLLAIDNFQALYCKTAYKDPFFNSIRSYHLSMPRLIMEFASGKRSFVRSAHPMLESISLPFCFVPAKGVVLGAITYSDPAYPVPLELREAHHAQSPYDRCSTTLLNYANGIVPIPVPEQLSLDEAPSLFKVWKEEQVMAPGAFSMPVFLMNVGSQLL
jgi:small subunit ribosomal protein S29